jgi:uncharacterized protein (DUF1800 family)
MLEYLDNAQSSAGKINENYARELMELHTLGVSGGASGSTYTQQDVQELARVLTGAGLNFNDANPKLPSAQEGMYIRRGLFEFNPMRHDQQPKVLLKQPIKGKGFEEIEHAVDLLCKNPATARFISRKLAVYFVADEPPAGLLDRMVRTFGQTDGSIDAVLKTMLLDKEFLSSLDGSRPRSQRFKDPMNFVVSSLRLSYEHKTITNYHAVVGWLTQLGEPLYGRVTPDGYPLAEAAWTSPGQLVRRFEIARAIGTGSAGLFSNEDNSPGPAIGFPLLTSRFYYDVLELGLAPKTRAALDRAASQAEWNTLLLASPDWMER